MRIRNRTTAKVGCANSIIVKNTFTLTHRCQTAGSAPNFQKIYSFLGSLFDPSTTGHVDQLRGMDDMDRQVVQLLMQNLASNLGKHHSIANEFQVHSDSTASKDMYDSMPVELLGDKLVQQQQPVSGRPGANP